MNACVRDFYLPSPGYIQSTDRGPTRGHLNHSLGNLSSNPFTDPYMDLVAWTTADKEEAFRSNSDVVVVAAVATMPTNRHNGRPVAPVVC